MLRIALFALAPLALFAVSVSAEEAIFAPGEKPALLQEKGAGEGPAWHPELGLLTSGGDGNIWRRNREGQAEIYRRNAGSNGLIFDRKGPLIICEPVRRRVSRIETNGDVTVLAETFGGFRFNQPNDVTIDSKDRIYFSDPCYGDRSQLEMKDADGRIVEGVYRIDPDGRVTRIITHEADRPNGLVVTHDDSFLFVADNNNSHPQGARKLWRFDLKPDGTINAESRHLVYDWKTTRGPDGMKLDAKGRLYVAAGLNTPNPPVETQDKPTAGVYVFSPSGELLEFVNIPRDETTNVAFGGDDFQTLFVTAGGSLWSLRTITPGKPVWPEAGNRSVASAPSHSTKAAATVLAGRAPDGTIVGGALKEPFGVDADSKGNLYLVELSGGRVLKLDSAGKMTTFAGNGEKGDTGDGGAAEKAVFNGMHNLAIAPNDDIYISDTWNQKIRRIDGSTGVVSTFAGTGKKAYSGDGGPATRADCGGLYCVSLDPMSRRVFVADLDNRRIRVIDAEGVIRTLAGNGQRGIPKDGEPANDQPLVDPRAVACDIHGNVYILERGGHALRVVHPDGKIFTVAGTGKSGPPVTDSPALQATLNGPKHLCIDHEQNVIIADAENHVVVKYLPKEKRLVRVAGTGKPGKARIGQTAPETELNRPHGVYVDQKGRLLIVDSYHNRLLRLEP